MEVTSVLPERGRSLFRLKDFELHPLHCLHLPGYVTSALEMAPGKRVEGRERKCAFRGDPYYEFESRGKGT